MNPVLKAWVLWAAAALERPSHWLLLTVFALGCIFVPLASAVWLGIAAAAAIVAEVAQARLAGRDAAAPGFFAGLRAADGVLAALSALLAYACLVPEDGKIFAVLAAQAGCARAAGLLCAARFAPRPVVPQPEEDPSGD